jgi:hypothetical protein
VARPGRTAAIAMSHAVHGLRCAAALRDDEKAAWDRYHDPMDCLPDVHLSCDADTGDALIDVVRTRTVHDVSAAATLGLHNHSKHQWQALIMTSGQAFTASCTP